MYVQNISPAKPYNPNFTSILPSLSVFYQYTDDNDYISTVRETQLTTGKRDDWNLKKMARIINHRFPKSQRVNIMPMNVSDGTEAYFIFKYLVEEVGGLDEFEKRFSHIAASDVCGEVLDKYPRQGRVDLSLKEAKKLQGASLFVTGGYDRGMTVFEDALEINFRELDKNIWGRQEYGMYDSVEKFLINTTETLQNLKNRLKFK